MQSQFETERSLTRTNLISTDRPDSSQLVDLHVYIIPKKVWKDRQNLAENEAMDQAISAGFLHVPQNLTIYDLRQNILNICGQDDEFPKEFVYLRSVGRCLTKVRAQQETDLRVKNYRPPTTIAPEIFVLEGSHDDDLLISTSQSYLVRETPIRESLTSPPHLTMSPQSWIKPIAPPPQPLTTYSSSNHSSGRQNSIIFTGPAMTSLSNLSTSSSTLSARDLAKLREEQERLRLRQIDLARQRREIELEQQKRTRELIEKQNSGSRIQREKQEAAAMRIQAAYRGFRHRRKMNKEQQQKRQISNFVEYRGLWSPEPEERRIRLSTKHRNVFSTPLERYCVFRNEHQWSASSSIESENIYTINSDTDLSFGFSSFRQAATEIERLKKEARDLTRRKAEKELAEEIQAHSIGQLADQLEELRTSRTELETTRETIVRQMQQFHAQISVRRKEERDLWKRKYLIAKKKTAALEERLQVSTKDQPLDTSVQIEQAKIRWAHSIKLRQQAENESQLLKQELQQIRLNMNTLQKTSLPKQPPPPSQQEKPTLPISLDITLQY